MRKATLQALVSYLDGQAVDNLSEIRDELVAELNKGAAQKAAAEDAYASAWEAVVAVLRMTSAPLTASEIFAEAEDNLPSGFTKGKVTYGLTHQWADRVVKVEGKVNTYRLA